MTLKTVESKKMRRSKYLGVTLFSIFFLSIQAESEPDEIKVVENCLDNSIEIKLFQNKPFSGSIYIEEYEKKDTCRKDYKDVKNPVLLVLHERCAPKNDGIVDVTAVIKSTSGLKTVRKIKCDYNKQELKAKGNLRIISPTTPAPTEDMINNLHQNVMKLWKTINDVLCDCNLKTYVNKIKSFVKPSE